MAGVTFEVQWQEVDLEKVKRGLALLARAGKDREPLLKEIGEVMVENTWERFDREIAPDGSPWAPLSDATKAAKQAKGRILKILQSTGILRNTVSYKVVDGETLAVGSPQEYAEIHQFGRPGPWIIRPKEKKALFWPGAAHPFASVKHPGIHPRPFLGVSEADKAAIQRIVDRWIRNALEGA